MKTDEELQKDVELVNKGKSYFLAECYCRPIISNVNLIRKSAHSVHCIFLLR